MDVVVRLIEVTVWPITVILLVALVRPHLKELLSRSKVKVTLFGIEIETTLLELEEATLAVLGRKPTQEQLDFLRLLRHGGRESYGKDGVPPEEREWIRPLMNAGLISTIPQEARLGDKEVALRLSELGELLLRRGRL